MRRGISSHLFCKLQHMKMEQATSVSADSTPPLSQLLPFRSCFCEGRTASLVTAWLQEIESVVLSILLGLYLLNSKIHHHFSPETLTICVSTFFVMMLANVLLGILLLYGAYNEIKKAVGFYIKSRAVYLVAASFAVLFFGTRLCIDHVHGGLGIIIIGILIVGSDLYMFLLVYSYYHLLKHSTDNEDRNFLI